MKADELISILLLLPLINWLLLPKKNCDVLISTELPLIVTLGTFISKSEPLILPPDISTSEPVIWPVDLSLKLLFEERTSDESIINPPKLPLLQQLYQT